MFALVHQMRTRIITSPSFTGERILAAILFENTMDRDIEKQPTADYLWNVKRIVPFLKVDKGLEAEKDGVQLMKPMPQLAALLDKARSKRIFGTKMRSVIKQANPAGIKNIVAPAVRMGRPRSSPLASCQSSSRKSTFIARKNPGPRSCSRQASSARLNELPAGQLVMLKLTLPEQADFYADCVRHPKVVRVVALSGGYSRKEANDRLRKNHGVVASFSRALVEGLTAQQTDAEFNAVLDASIQSIFEASIT